MVAFAVTVFGEMTKLGDSRDYLSGMYVVRDDVTSPAYLMSVIGIGLYSILGSEFLVYSIFAFLGAYSLTALIVKANLPRASNIIVILGLSSPSFTMWSSILSKEAIVLIATCVFLIDLINIDCRARRSLTFWGTMSLFVLCWFKLYYAPIYISFLIITLLNRNSTYNRQNYIFLFGASVVLIGITFSIGFAGLVVDEMPKHFSTDGGSTRQNDFWNSSIDFFVYLPIGSLISFVGPTIGEVYDKPFLLIVFLESLILILLIISLFQANYTRLVFKKHILILVFFVFFGFLFVHYPFGIFNQGSAIRYRTNFLLFMFVYFAHLLRLNKTTN
ncbi:MAG: hypothetical protein CMM07_23555 [Rhodopirellula sp.]|nr:hypothetical protein [Rhodopirellula sp.]